MKTKITAFVNQKGGVGKTTTTVNLGAYLADAGKKVLLIDFDPQGNLSSNVGIADVEKGIYELGNLSSNVGIADVEKGIYELLAGQADANECVYETPVDNLFVCPTDINLAGGAVELISVDDREFVLKEAMDEWRGVYDYIFIDCPPALGVLTINALTAADEVIVPLQCEYFALEGLSQLLDTIEMVRNSTNPKLTFPRILFTMYDSRTLLSRDVVDNLNQNYPDRLFKTIIPRNVKLAEAPSHGVPINLYDSLCLGAKSYENLAKEYMNDGK